MSNSQDEHNWDKMSGNSDVSANTDIKVFHGAITGKEDLFKKLNNQKPQTTSKITDKFSFNKISSSKGIAALTKGDDKLRAINLKSIEKTYKDLNEDAKKIDSKEEEPSELLSFRNEQDITSNMSRKNAKESEENNKNQQILLKFKDITEEDEEIINNGLSPKNLNRTMLDKAMTKTLTNSKIFFKVAMIEKGIALLVSNDDCIFTLPTFLLPKQLKIGATYSFNIEESNNNTMIKNKIILMQKNFLPSTNN